MSAGPAEARRGAGCGLPAAMRFPANLLALLVLLAATPPHPHAAAAALPAALLHAACAASALLGLRPAPDPAASALTAGVSGTAIVEQVHEKGLWVRGGRGRVGASSQANRCGHGEKGCEGYARSRAGPHSGHPTLASRPLHPPPKPHPRALPGCAPCAPD